MSQLITLTVPACPVEFTAEAKAQRMESLCTASAVVSVTDEESQAVAVAAQHAVNDVLKAVENARKSAKEPLLEAGRTLDNAAKEFVERLKMEQLRLAQLVGCYQMAEEDKARAAARAADLERARIAREEAERVAKAEQEAKDAIEAAQTEEAKAAALAKLEAARVNAEALAAQELEAVRTIQAPARAEGQSVRHDWEITRLNEIQLARARPDLVRKIEFDMRAVKEDLDRGLTLPGVEARKVVKSTVRATR